MTAVKGPPGFCSSGGPQPSSAALPYGALKQLGESQGDVPCGAPLSVLNGALVCAKCDHLPLRPT